MILRIVQPSAVATVTTDCCTLVRRNQYRGAIVRRRTAGPWLAPIPFWSVLASTPLDPSQLNLRAVVVVALGVVTTIVLLAVVPKGAPQGAIASGGSTPPVTTTLPAASTTAPGGTTQTTTAATTTTKPATTTTRKRGSSGSNTTAPTTTTFPVAGRPVLKLGSNGPDVVSLQQRLAALGYNPGTTNGNFDAGTQTAVINFQKAKKLTADGVVGATTWAALAAG
jgi:hypothetical protein